MTIRDLHDEHEREFANSALEILVDQAMGEYPEPDHALGTIMLRNWLVAEFRRRLTPERTIEWAAKISEDVMSFEDYQAREIGD